MATTWEGVCNEVLRELGVKKRIGAAYEGSEVSKAFLEVYSTTRDNLIRSADWDFARRRNVALTLFKGPPPLGGYGPWAPWTPAYPPPGWRYEYLYPSDCIQFAAIVPLPTLYPILDPRPELWSVEDDGFNVNGIAATAQKVILSNLPNALGTYRARITNPALWDAGFLKTFINALAETLSVPLANLQVKQAEQQTEAAVGTIAEMRRG